MVNEKNKKELRKKKKGRDEVNYEKRFCVSLAIP
jgi:hypothetical protein